MFTYAQITLPEAAPEWIEEILAAMEAEEAEA